MISSLYHSPPPPIKSQNHLTYFTLIFLVHWGIFPNLLQKWVNLQLFASRKNTIGSCIPSRTTSTHTLTSSKFTSLYDHVVSSAPLLCPQPHNECYRALSQTIHDLSPLAPHYPRRLSYRRITIWPGTLTAHLMTSYLHLPLHDFVLPSGRFHPSSRTLTPHYMTWYSRLIASPRALC